MVVNVREEGFGNLDAAHYECIEFGRKQWQYRLAGSAIVKDEASSRGFLTDHKWKDGSVCAGAFSWSYITKDIDLSKVLPSMDGSKFMVMVYQLDMGQ